MAFAFPISSGFSWVTSEDPPWKPWAADLWLPAAMGAGTRLGRCAAALAVAAVSSSWYFVVPSLRQKSLVARAAEGYFPGVEVETTDAPNRGSLLERLQEAIPEDEAVGEHTEEVKLLREQTAILAQELRLLKELLQDGSLADAISQLQILPEVEGSPAPPEEEINQLPSSKPAPVEPPAAICLSLICAGTCDFCPKSRHEMLI